VVILLCKVHVEVRDGMHNMLQRACCPLPVQWLPHQLIVTAGVVSQSVSSYVGMLQAAHHQGLAIMVLLPKGAFTGDTLGACAYR
jgi:hypothetical protein